MVLGSANNINILYLQKLGLVKHTKLIKLVSPKVLQDVEEYGKLKAGIRNQAKTKDRQITSEQQEDLHE